MQFSHLIYVIFEHCLGFGGKFRLQSSDFKFFSVISPNAGNAVQDAGV